MRHTWAVNDFSIGFEQTYPEQSINFQPSYLHCLFGDPVLPVQLRKVAPGTRNLALPTAGLIPLAERAKKNGELLWATMCYQGAAFVTLASDPCRYDWWKRFRELSNVWHDIGSETRDVAPFGGIEPPVLRFTPEGRNWGIVTLMNGLDGYLEEFTHPILALCGVRFEAITFGGLGQGEVLETSRALMVPEWEHPIVAALDHFGLDDVTVPGCSFGSGPAVRAAAFEPRITRVICFDVLPNLFGSLAGVAPTLVRELFWRMAPLGIGR